jgi:hypothetical protein
MTTQNIAKYHDLWKLIVISLVLSLVGRVTRSVRGITLNFDGVTIRMTVFFEEQPRDRDIENMQDVEAELVSHHDYRSELVLSVVPLAEGLADRVGDWGWVFLRCED